ncbi:hypothetical protein FACS1894214_2330 [Planctomycetales bacterium]|nr:hypothetical protein FACS1894214_2330 [Planctomycetales bacterium]
MSKKTAMENWVVLFVRTGSENKLLQTLKENLNTDDYLPFLPSKETSFRRKGIVHKFRKPLFPGYIFLQTEKEPSIIADDLKAVLRGVKGIYSLLHYGSDKTDVAMCESERLYWERLFDSDFCIAGSVGFIEGDKVYVTSGALVGLEGSIKKINRHKREAIIEMEMMGTKREVTLMLEIVGVA